MEINNNQVIRKVMKSNCAVRWKAAAIIAKLFSLVEKTDEL